MNIRVSQPASAARQNEMLHEDPTADDHRPRRTKWGIAEMVLMALVLLVIFLHLKYFLDVRTAVPHEDEWRLLDEMFQALDQHRFGSWAFQTHNGHFLVPGALAYLASLRYFSLDLTALRLLNFPICLTAFLLTAHVINADAKSRFLRLYLYAGTCFIIFNLCLWEHFSQGIGFTVVSSAVFGSIALYYVAKAVQLPSRQRKYLIVGFVFLCFSALSAGAGYPAAVSALFLFALSSLRKLTSSRALPLSKPAVCSLACAFGLLAMASHPAFHLKSWVTQTAFHSVLVAGSVGSSFFDRKDTLALNVAFAWGLLLVFLSLAVGADFLARRRIGRRLLPIFSVGLVIFGLFSCMAVAVARSRLPDGEFLASRYTLYSSICLLGGLLYLACWKVFWLANLWCLAAVGYCFATVKEIQIARYRPAVYKKIEATIRNIDNLSDDQLTTSLYWRENTAGVRRVMTRMRRDRLNLFRGSADPSSAPH